MLVFRDPVEREVRDEALPDEIASASRSESSLSSLERMLSVQSLICSLRLLSCSLIWFLFDQRNTPAPTDAAATAAAVIGLSFTTLIQSLLY